MTQPIPNELWNAAPKDATWWMAATAHSDLDYNSANECPGHEYVSEGGDVDLAYCDGSCVESTPDCPGHGPGTEDEPDFCDGSCVTRPKEN